MSWQYDYYLHEHIRNVRKAVDKFLEWFPDALTSEEWDLVRLHAMQHDDSKYKDDEYDAYDKYFYGGNRSYKVVKDFNYAWLHHIHNNPHHWQYWILKHDDEPEEVLDMPHDYIFEMIADWWSFSYGKGELREIFDWYEKHKDIMQLSPKTRAFVEDILTKMKQKLDEEDEE